MVGFAYTTGFVAALLLFWAGVKLTCRRSGPVVRPSCPAQFDRILPSLAAFVWQEAREGDRLSLVEPLGELPQWARSSVKGSSRWMLNEKVT